jgi:hypothetical protein
MRADHCGLRSPTAAEYLVDEALIWQLMRFPDETDKRGNKRSFGPTNDPTSSPLSRR